MSSLRKDYSRIAGSSNFMNRPCTVDGSPMADANMAVDGSFTPVDFWVQPPSSNKFKIEYISLLVSDGGSLEPNNYGSVTGPLSNGLVFFSVIDGVETILSPNPIKTNIQLLDLASESQFYQTSGDRIVIFREIIVRYSDGTLLDGASGDRYGIRVRDNLSTLSAHSCQLKGEILLSF